MQSEEYLQSEVVTIFEIKCFLTCSWRFLRSNILEQFKSEKIIGIKKPQKKLQNVPDLKMKNLEMRS